MTLPPPLRRFTVLVVEDDLATLKAFSQVIAQVFGCTVLSASSGEAALRTLESGEKIDLLFSDVVMPEMDGLTLTRLVRDQLPELPIILTTGAYQQIESVISNGVVPLLKPFTREQLEAVFAEQLSPLLRLQPARDNPYSTM
jgi:CheY-like chemotaxis protein